MMMKQAERPAGDDMVARLASLPDGHLLDEKPGAGAAFDLAVVVPTRDEAGNVARLIETLDAALADIRFEIIFVDDWSSDGTAQRIAELTVARADIRVIRRYGRNGLASAAIEGMMATMAPVVAVIDGDGQHDEQLLPRLYAAVISGSADVAIGSRYCADGSTGSWDAGRVRASRIATRLSHIVLPSPVADPMSGFFAIRREIVENLLPQLSGRGFKILFDLLTSSRDPLRVVELPYRFRPREHGESKLGAAVVADYMVMVVDRLIRRFLPSRFVMFAAVGTLGLGVHLAVLSAMLSIQPSFRRAQTVAVLVAIAFNFWGNNVFTFRDRRLKGMRIIGGFLSFYAVCGLGALADIGVGDALFARHQIWWVSGIAGAILGSLWNFAASTMVTWRRR